MATLSPPYKIVLVLQDLEFGGTQRYALNLIRHLDRSLFEPELWVLRGGDDMTEIARKTGVRIRWFSRSTWVTPAALLRLLYRLGKNRPVYLYPLTVVPNIWARLFGSLFRVPFIISSYRNLVARQYESLLWPLSTHIICNAEAIREKLIKTHKTDPKKISVIPNGVDTDHFHPCHEKQSSPPTIVYGGRLVKQKDPLTLLKAFKRIQQVIPETRLQVIGNGPMAPLVEHYTRKNGLEGKVSLIAGTTDIRDYLQQARLFLLPSRYEGSPNILIEAMACGLPAVATKTSGIPELIEHGVNGYMVPIGDFQKMAECVVQLLENDEDRIKMGTEARKRVIKSHSLRACVRKTEAILLDQLSE